MKRNINLQDLSKDHHHGLLLGWKIRQGFINKADITKIKDYINYFFNAALLPHFKEEEDIVLSCLPDSNELKQQTIAEHSLIEQLAKRIRYSEQEEDLFFLAETLASHIRFEERTLFPFLEKHLSAKELDDIGRKIKNNHQPFIDTYEYEFWKFSD